ncbi:MAG TPA: [FeFe] hydrogenase H-cluster radical SAM maturase HydG [Spirochaetota bacterium]|nr:[FeFe] hydrogenase H-cluster radical SAM maturase HydG [Spirochaetota bacterium]HOM38433.1 [FeFe] hydrogenase H-cluster radical SAM maturase HydG [Spirochaetota bacterium]HPQ48972.1 [FeFe] hydrogenase H-cluster radical SAM maturase HydG [Spirochaetota bacterium]
MINVVEWVKNRIIDDEIERYTDNGRDFINDDYIESLINNANNKKPDPKKIRDILNKSLAIQTLSLEDVAELIKVSDPDLIEEMKEVAHKIKLKVYDNRIVTFAPLYMGNLCVNNCLYCGFRDDNSIIKRRVLNIKEIEDEVKVLAGEIGHKRLIVVYGEHPSTDVNYIAKSLETIYNVKVKVRNGWGQIRRVNVNAAPMQIKELEVLRDIGIGTFQVFQETYHKKTYSYVHPSNTIKGNYLWRLYSMHRALEAGIDDVGIGALFGLYDWRFEVISLVAHAIELEKKFGIGPHTVSFPRLEPAANTPFIQETRYRVSDDDFKKIILILRLAIPYTGMILTAREPKELRNELVDYGITQMDASTKIGIGAYSDRLTYQELEKQQFEIGDTRTLDELIRDLAKKGYITSFCTAGYRCGRTGSSIMDLLRSGKEGVFCKLNAVITFREWLLDFASKETEEIGLEIINKELREIEKRMPDIYPKVIEYYKRIENGERDLYF